MKMSSQESTITFGPEIQKYIVSEECVCGCHHTDRERDTQKMSDSIGGHNTPYACTLVHTHCAHAHMHTHTRKHHWKLGRERR